MADAFAPKLSADVQYERPVEMPSMIATVAELGSNFARAFTSEREAASTAAKVDPQLSVFKQGLDRVEAIRQEKGEAAALIAERQLASNFAMAGIDLGTEYKAVYETTTGRPWAGYGMDNEARMMQSALQQPEVQASYLASFAVNKDWTEEQRIEYAIGQQATINAAANEIGRSKAEGGYRWSISTESAYNTVIDNFLNTNIGSLIATEKSGGRVGPQAIANLQATWAQTRVAISRPPNITDDQWKATQDRISNIDQLLSTFEKAKSSGVLNEEIVSAYANALMERGDPLAALVAIKDPGTLATLAGGDYQTTIMELAKGLPVQTTTSRLFDHVLADGGMISGQEDPNSFLKSVPTDLLAGIEGKSSEDLYNGLKASGKLTMMIDQNALNRPDARQQFVVEASKIGSVLMAANQGQFLSNDFLRQLVANPGFIRNVKALDTLAPDDALTVRKYVRSGLNVELARQRRNLEAIEAQNGLVWDGSSYGEGMTTQAMLEGMEPVPSGTTINTFALQQAYDRRKAIDTISRTLGELAVQVPEGQGMPVGGDVMGVIRGFEGFSNRAYWDVNAYRAGYGSDTVTRADGTVERVTENTVVTREDAERDLARRTQEFSNIAEKKVGKQQWATLAPNVRAALTSITYNYGEIPDRLMPAIRSGSAEQIAQAVEGLAGDNEGVNRRRRLQEAAIIRGESVIQTATLPPTPQEIDAQAQARQGVAQRTRTALADTAPQAAPAEAPQEQATAEAMSMPEEILQRQERERQTPELTIPAEIRNLIEQLGGNPNTTQVVADRSEVSRLINEGSLREGDLVVIGDMLQVVTKAMVDAAK